MSDEDALIRQQIEYYRARAPEYEEWFFRKGRYDRGKEHNNRWFIETSALKTALKTANPCGDILELACGTGLWTQHLAPAADKLIAIDISPEAINLNRTRLSNNRIDFIEADIFSWKPSMRFDFIFFGFWLSHVPTSRFDDFWNLIDGALKPKGAVFFVDSLFEQGATAGDHPSLEKTGRTRRKLNDGREYEIVKVFYDPLDLERRLGTMGWIGSIKTTGRFFLYGYLRRE